MEMGAGCAEIQDLDRPLPSLIDTNGARVRPCSLGQAGPRDRQAGKVRNLRWGALSSMTDDRVDFASMLASRLCHDLLSPVGAFANGLELLADERDPEMRARCIDLHEQTARPSAAEPKRS